MHRERARVVVADDHPGIVDAVTSMLMPSFDVVAAAHDGASAIDAVSRLAPDLVVLDVAMPGIDGFQTAARIRASGSDARIVFLSNYAGADFVLAGLSRGASAFVSKVRMELDLVAAVGHALDGRSFVPSAAVLPLWRRPAGRRHDLLSYESDAFLTDAATAFFDNALDAGDSILWIASEPHLRALDTQLAARGRDVASLLASGRYTRMESAVALEAVCRDGQPTADLYAAAVDPILERALAAATGATPHLSIAGAIAPVLVERGEVDAAMRLERIADGYAASRPVSILCTYPAAALAGDSMACVCAEHATIVGADVSR